MSKNIISTENAPGAIGPYSQGIKTGNLVFTSGQLPMDSVTGEMPDGIEAQSRQSLKNVQAILEAAGTTLQNTVKVTVFLKDMNDFTKMNEVYSQFFTSEYPRATA